MLDCSTQNKISIRQDSASEFHNVNYGFTAMEAMEGGLDLEAQLEFIIRYVPLWHSTFLPPFNGDTTHRAILHRTLLRDKRAHRTRRHYVGHENSFEQD